MARIRSLKIGFFTNEQLAALSPFHRLLFAGLWVIADKAGRLEDRPRRIKAELFPYDELNVDQMLTELDTAGFITRYTVRGMPCIEIPAFAEHQNPHPKEADSALPAPAKKRGSAVKGREKKLPATGQPGGSGSGSGDLGLGDLSYGNGLGGGEGNSVRAPVRQDAEGRFLNEGGAWRPAGLAPRTPGLIDGESLRWHGKHVWCWFERPSLCVTKYIHEQSMSQLGGEIESRSSRAIAIYDDTKRDIGDRPVGDDPLDFWRNTFAAKVGTVTVKAETARGKGHQTVDAVQAALAKRHSGGS